MANKREIIAGVDYIGVCVVFWCHDGRGRVLFHQRGQKCRDERGRWDCGGGAMEVGETIEQAVRREIKEEYGVNPKRIQYLATKNVLRKHNGKKTHWLKIMHRVLVDAKKVKNNNPEKIDRIGWFKLDKLPRPLHSQIGKEVKIIKDFRGK